MNSISHTFNVDDRVKYPRVVENRDASGMPSIICETSGTVTQIVDDLIIFKVELIFVYQKGYREMGITLPKNKNQIECLSADDLGITHETRTGN